MLFSRQDHETLAAILAEAGRREVMPRFRNLAEGEIREKRSATDLVTEADEAAERFISAELARAFPGATLVGEEAAAADPALLERLADAELAFVIDPIDGTLNYASDLPLFAVMAAALVKGEVVAAVIHDPVVEDSAMALRGEGAWLARTDGKSRDLRVAPGAAPSEMTGMMSWQYFPEPLRSELPAPMLGVWETAVRFQFWHALALAVCATSVRRTQARQFAATLFALGIALFCGSLYALALGAPRGVGIVTPLGGIAFIAGWIALGAMLFRQKQS
ncbi:MAG: DUF423 domain-containing protein [Bosea sp.]|nr:DUF423 domain-containing protein [Bosea sp. (in: a-proteobacteria)]